MLQSCFARIYDLLVDTRTFISHYAYGEVLLDMLAGYFTVNLINTRDKLRHFIDIMHQIPSCHVQ